MSTPADRSVRGRRRTIGRPGVIVTLVIALGLLGAPARALHQYCGDDLVGTGSETNGHPDLDAGNRAWGGIGILQELERTEQALVFARETIADVAGNLVDVADLLHAIAASGVDVALQVGTPASQLYYTAVKIPVSTAEKALRISSFVLLIAAGIIYIAESVIAAQLFDYSRRVADEDACGGTLSGDMAHSAWVALVQRNLARTGPPLAMLVAPYDPTPGSSSPPWPVLPRDVVADDGWCPPIPDALATGELPTAPQQLADTGGDCTSTVQLGFLDAPDLGVQDIVTTTIAHLQSHGVDVRNAPDLLAQADAALAAERWTDAFHLYRAAYQNAMGLTTS